MRVEQHGARVAQLVFRNGSETRGQYRRDSNPGLYSASGLMSIEQLRLSGPLEVGARRLKRAREYCPALPRRSEGSIEESFSHALMELGQNAFK
jgi:hypothetical protein